MLGIVGLAALVFFVLYMAEKKKFIHLVKIKENTGNGVVYKEYAAKQITFIEKPVLILWYGGIFRVWDKRRRWVVPLLTYENKIMHGKRSFVYEFGMDEEGNLFPLKTDFATCKVEGIPSDLKLFLANEIEHNVELTTKNDFWTKWGGVVTIAVIMVFVFLIILFTMKYWSEAMNETTATIRETAAAMRNQTSTMVQYVNQVQQPAVVPP